MTEPRLRDLREWAEVMAVGNFPLGHDVKALLAERDTLMRLADVLATASDKDHEYEHFRDSTHNQRWALADCPAPRCVAARAYRAGLPGWEPRGCPTPGACSCPDDAATVERVARAIRLTLEPEGLDPEKAAIAAIAALRASGGKS